jgi:quinone-modifying oxidoreductase subunit QmoC
MRFWRAMKERDGITAPAKSVGASFAAALKSIFVHDKFNFCTTERSRSISHMCVFYGFIALAVVPVWIITARFNPLLQNFSYPFSFWNPWRMLANLGGAVVLAGCGLMIWARMKKSAVGGRNTYFDWAFLGTVVAVVLTGFASEALHYVRMEPHRQAVYFIHLVLVFALLMYLPYSKFAHLVYRTTAMAYAEYSGRTSQAPAAATTADQAAKETEQAEEKAPQGEPSNASR